MPAVKRLRDEVAAADLLVAGPGPGDPREAGSTRIARMRQIIAARRAVGAPLLAVCLSHQILADSIGLDLVPLDSPHQGLQKEVDIFGLPATVGFYNTFTALVDGETTVELEAAADETGAVHALRGPHTASVQGHLESILSRNGLEVLEALVGHALT